MTIEKARSLLDAHGQSHILRFWDTLPEPSRQNLLRQIGDLDFELIAEMRALVRRPSLDPLVSGIIPAPVVEHTYEARRAATEIGDAALRRGELGVILVAGGQGSRLGYDGPKGCYPIGPVSDAPLFHFHARKILALEKNLGLQVPLYIMTSPMNDAATRSFFAEHDFFGLDSRRVLFFRQNMWPAMDAEGRLVADAPDSIFLGPDGHGGTLSALKSGGCLADMKARGLKHIFYLQVDNPLVDIGDPAFLGEHIRGGSDMSLKVCRKRGPDEGLGVVVVMDGKTRVVEYSELTDEQKRATTADGKLLFSYGSVAIHIFSVEFLRREADAGLPIHLAFKKVPVCDSEGRAIMPREPNAYKFEKFIFDALADTENSCCLAFERSDEFSPVKNAQGEDSPATCRRDLSTKWAKWLLKAGVSVELDSSGYAAHNIEIDPCYASDAGALARRLKLERPVLDGSGDILLRD